MAVVCLIFLHTYKAIHVTIRQLVAEFAKGLTRADSI